MIHKQSDSNTIS